MGFLTWLLGDRGTLDLQTQPKTPEVVSQEQLDAKQSRAKRLAVMEARFSAIPIPVEIRQWESGMIHRKGPKVLVHKDEVDWPLALMIIRYGQGIEHWPMEFSPLDIQRARQWAERNETPSGVEYLEVKNG